jgi:plastocyanin
MKRRDFLRTAGGAAGAATATSAAASSAAAADGVSAVQDGNTTQPGGNGTDGGNGTAGNQTDGNDTDGGSDLPGAGETETVIVGPGGDLVYEPASLEILPGTQVVFEWDSDTHNIVPESQPDDANWSGHNPIENTGFSYSYTFTVEGEYAYYCQPHRSAGMEATITVTEDAGAAGGGGGGYEPPDPAHMGIPVQKHFVGALAFMGIFVTLVFTFYLLKYGESAHTAAPSKED